MTRRIPWVAVLFGMVVPAGLYGQKATGAYVTTEARPNIGTPGWVIYVVNRSAEAIIVKGVHFTECVNIRGGCGLVPLKIRIAAGGEAIVHRVLPRYDNAEGHFQYTFLWEPERADAPPPDAPPPPPPPVAAVPKPEPPSPAPVPAPTPAPAPSSDSTRSAPPPPAAPPTAIDTLGMGENDSLVVSPTSINIHVGQTVNPASVLDIWIRTERGRDIPAQRFRYLIESGTQFLKGTGQALMGIAPGEAVLVFSRALPPGSPGRLKGMTRVAVHVIP